LTALRERVLAQIEPLRKEKQIGSSLQAKVVVSASSDELAFLQAHARYLPMLFIVSQVELKESVDGATTVTISRADGVKCERCWRYVKSVSNDPAWAGLCDRCQGALAEPIHG
jgi:isoleucyl-tRNA synthetase